MTGRPPGKPAPAFLELRGVALHPAHDRRMRHRQAALGHHLYQVAQTELEPKIPAHAQDDDFAVEVATLEQLRYRLQLAHRRPQPAQHANVVDRSPPFAPEPPEEKAPIHRHPGIRGDADVPLDWGWDVAKPVARMTVTPK